MKHIRTQFRVGKNSMLSNVGNSRSGTNPSDTMCVCVNPLPPSVEPGANSSEAKRWNIVWADALKELPPNICWPTQWYLISCWAHKFKENKNVHCSCAYKQSASLIAGVWERLLDSISQRLSYTSASIKASFDWSLWKRAILFQVLDHRAPTPGSSSLSCVCCHQRQ